MKDAHRDNRQMALHSAEQLPPWHRFSLPVHCLSVVSGIAITLLIYAGFAVLWGRAEFTELMRSMGQFYFGLAALVIIGITCSIPATWFCVVLARRYGWGRYWQFGMLGLVGALVVTLIVGAILSVPVSIVVVEPMFRSGFGDAWENFAGPLAGLSIIAVYLAPVGVVTALTYRFIAGRTSKQGEKVVGEAIG